MMAKLRHVAMSVPDADVPKTAKFYEEAFGLRRVQDGTKAVLLTDGVMSLAILSDRLTLNLGHRGIHHIGFLVDDIGEARERIAAAGTAQAIDDEETAKVNEQVTGTHPGTGDGDIEHKFIDPNGVTFDVVNDDYASRFWRINLT
jgi:methylmalonyl-CoA/ethylmalonyl-CoA epimerase